MKKKFTCTLLFAIFISLIGFDTVFAQNEPSYQAYISNSRTMWQRAMDQTKPGSYAHALAQYGYLNGTMSDRNKEAFDKYYDPILDLLDELIASEDHVAECKAIKSSVYGLELAYNSWKGMFLGPKSSRLIEEAYQSAPDNPLVVKLFASSKLYTPEAFGGNPALAVKEFSRAVLLFESQAQHESNWLYLNALALLGNAYRKTGNLEKAMETYNKALSIEQKFGWIAHSLKPSLENQMSKK